jgi:uncharacterized membrane protein YdjX (TVP38/TMEM64 family)
MMESTHNNDTSHSETKTIRDIWKPLLLLGIVIIIIILSALYNKELKAYFLLLRDWIKSLGVWAPIGYIAIYIVATVVALPGLFLGVIAGSVFGGLVGVIIVSISSTISAGLAFLIARRFARDAAKRWMGKYKRLQRLDELTEKHGAVIVGISRLNFLFPFNLLNYAFGLTKIPFRTYIFWSWLCMLPTIIMVVVFSDVVTESLFYGKISFTSIGVVISAIFFLGILVFLAQKKFRQLNR